MLRFPIKNKTPFKVPTYLAIVKQNKDFNSNELILNDTHIKLFGYNLISVVKYVKTCKYDENMLVKMNNLLGFAQGKWSFESEYYIGDDYTILDSKYHYNISTFYTIGDSKYDIKNAFNDYRNCFKYIDEEFKPLPQNIKYKKINNKHVYFGNGQGFKIGDMCYDPNFTITWSNVPWVYILQYCQLKGINPPKTKFDAINNPKIILNRKKNDEFDVFSLIPVTQRGDKKIKTKEDAIQSAITYLNFHVTE
jgi:hypothetical protein